MGLGLSFGPRFARVRVTSRGVRMYGSVGVGPVSYGWQYGGSRGGGSRGGGGGGTRTVYIERMTAAEIREAGEEEARQDALRKERRERRRAERDAEWDERERKSAERWAEHERKWAEREADREAEREREEREEAERKEAEREADRAELRAEVESWVKTARLQGHTHIELFYCFSWNDTVEVVLPVEEVLDYVLGMCPQGGWGEDEPRCTMLDSYSKP